MIDEPFWISNSIVALERPSQWTSTKNVPESSKWKPINRCISSFWMNTELCFALWPLANEWNHEGCNEKNYFICEETPSSGKQI